MNMDLRRILNGLICASAVVLCMQDATAGGERIAAFYKNQVDPHFALVHAGVDAAAKQLGATVTHYAPTRPNNLGEQLSQLEDVTVKKPDALVFMAVDPRGVVPAIEKVNGSGIPVINYNDRVAAGKFASVVVADDYNLGLDVARYLLRSIGGKGNVIILEGVKGSTTSDERVRGFHKALTEFPNVRILASQPANYQRLQALQVTENLMQTNASIDGVLAAADVMAFGAIEALEAAGRKQTKVVGVGGVPESVEAIKAGRLLATSEFNGYKMGCIATMAAGAASPEQLIDLMIGRRVGTAYQRTHSGTAGEVALQTTRLTTDTGVRGVDLHVRCGEIVGLSGLVGSGRTEVVRAVFGADPIASGEVRIFGKKVSGDPHTVAAMGVALIPENRKQEGLALKRTVMISSELPEIVSLCDRAYVMKDGAIAGELQRSDLSEQAILTLALHGA